MTMAGPGQSAPNLIAEDRHHTSIDHHRNSINIQELGKKFIERVLAVQWKHGVAEETKDGEAHLEFKVGVTGWEEGERSSRRTASLDLTDIG